MLVLEYMEGGDLAAALQNDSGSGVLADRKLRWYAQGASLARDIAEALVFLHSRQTMHLDLKCKNVLLTKDWQKAKIADVGLSRVLGHTQTTSTMPMGTFAYA
eukprot:jgi/Astpho2/5033/Aster-05963